MLLPSVPQFRRRRGARRLTQSPPPPPPPPPPAPDSIVSVTHDGTDAVIVEVSSIVNSIDGVDALWLTPDGGTTWFVPTGASIPDETHVRFTFDVDVSACTMWHVQDPVQWEWLDMGTMNGPFDGEIVP